jgi:hypothetical protein
METLADWIPDLKELLLFIVFMFILIIFILMLHYHIIQMGVQKESRCIREEEKYAAGTKYDITGMTKRNVNKYTVSYDMDARQTTASCACPDGKVVNHFTEVPWYNLRTNTASSIKDLMCYCDKSYDDPTESTYYKGHPGLIRFYQNNKDTSFFNKEL